MPRGTIYLVWAKGGAGTVVLAAYHDEGKAEVHKQRAYEKLPHGLTPMQILDIHKVWVEPMMVRR